MTDEPAPDDQTITIRERLPGRWEARQGGIAIWAPTPEEALRVLTLKPPTTTGDSSA